MQKGPLFGLVANNIWTFDGATGGNASNQMLLNPFVSYHFRRGLGVKFVASDHGELDRHYNKWTIPVGGGMSKVVRIGGLPLELDAYCNATRPIANQDPWQLQDTLTFVFSEQQARPVLTKDPRPLPQWGMNDKTHSEHHLSCRNEADDHGASCDSAIINPERTSTGGSKRRSCPFPCTGVKNRCGASMIQANSPGLYCPSSR